METINNEETTEVDTGAVPEEDVEIYLEQENQNNVNKEKQVDNGKVENE